MHGKISNSYELNEAEDDTGKCDKYAELKNGGTGDGSAEQLERRCKRGDYEVNFAGHSRLGYKGLSKYCNYGQREQAKQ